MEATIDHQKAQLQVMLVGRPNVGKSRLFNRLCGRRISIVHNQAGVTRVIIPVEIFPGVILMDTGGIGLSSVSDEPLVSAIEEQIDFAITLADLIFFIVDASTGCLPLDFEIAQKLRQSGKPIRLLANKVDLERHQTHLDTFYTLGFGAALAVSAEHGRGEEDIRQEICVFSQKHLLFHPQTNEKERPIAICFVGRPNVGKSSLLNALLHEKKTIVSPIPGTTRDSISFHLKFHGPHGEWHFQLIDTAGIKTNKKIHSSLEYFSQIRTEKAIEQAHIIFLVIDALSGVSKMDQQFSKHILEEGKGLVVVVNKWDLAEQSFREGKLKCYETLDDFQSTFQKAVRKELLAAPDAPVIFTSAYDDQRTSEELLFEAHDLFLRMNQPLSTGKLNRAIQQIIKAQPPVAVVGRRFKIYYAAQTGNFPFMLKIFCNQKERLSDSYKRYLENGLRKHFPLKGCPLRFDWVGKEKRYLQTFSRE
jgi:GTP-binding protein